MPGRPDTQMPECPVPGLSEPPIRPERFRKLSRFGLMHSKQEKNVLKTFSSVLRLGVSRFRRKRIENVPNRIENVEGQKIRKRKKRFLRFRWEARKDNENVKNVSKTY